MQKRNSIVSFTIPSNNLKYRKFVTGFVISSTEEAVSVKDSVVITGPLCSRVFKQAKNLPGIIIGWVRLSPNHSPRADTIWKVDRIEKLESPFGETAVDQLSELRDVYLSVDEEVKAIRLRFVEQNYDMFESQPEAVAQQIDAREQQLIRKRLRTFSEVVNPYLVASSIAHIAADLNLDPIHQEETPLDVLIQLQDRYVIIRDEELCRIEAEVHLQLGRTFTREPSKAWPQAQPEVIERCKHLIKDRLQQFEAVVEKHTALKAVLPEIKSKLESNLRLQSPIPLPGNRELVLLGVVDSPAFED